MHDVCWDNPYLVAVDDLCDFFEGRTPSFDVHEADEDELQKYPNLVLISRGEHDRRCLGCDLPHR